MTDVERVQLQLANLVRLREGLLQRAAEVERDIYRAEGRLDVLLEQAKEREKA